MVLTLIFHFTDHREAGRVDESSVPFPA